VVSGSHNDFRWNALKFINAGGALLNPVQGEEVLDLYHAGEFTKAPWDRLGRESELADYAAEYLAETVGRLDVASIRKARFRVVLDLGNGTCGTAVAAFFGMLGCRPILINEETLGDFARDPAPTPANMRQLASLLKHVEADVGFAVNTDVDRVGLVTDHGEALSEECTLPLVAAHVLRDSGQVVVTNLSTSQMIERVVQNHGGTLIRTKIGEGNVVFRSINEHALLGGEGSGGVAYLPIVRGFDGYLVMGLILEAMAQSGRRISELAAELPSFCMRKGVVPCSPDRVYYALEEIRRLFREEAIDLTDGVRVAWPGRWLHVRASNTEPLLRIIAEGEDQDQLDRLFDDTTAIVNAVVHGKS
jgi:phosphomannomutase